MSEDFQGLPDASFEMGNLIFKYLQQEISPEEKLHLDTWVNQSEQNKKLFQELIDKDALHEKWILFYHAVEETEVARQKILKKIRPQLHWQSRWLGLAAAVLVIVSFVTYQWLNKSKTGIATPDDRQTRFKNDISAPLINRATITLDDGRTIYLDSIENGTILTKNNVRIVKTGDGKVSYNPQRPLAGGVEMVNKLNNPRGSKVIDVVLADGSRVWLNSESSIEFPIAFYGNKRKVTITGEAYFEVAKDKKREFIVEANGTTIEVLGTHFNINAYGDKGSIITTLLEGSVKFKKGIDQVNILPGQQALATGNSISVNKDADTDIVMAWKNGYIVFDHTDMATILKQIARWYDVNVIVNGDLNVLQINGELQRTMNLSEVLTVLEINTRMRFVIEGKTVRVLP